MSTPAQSEAPKARVGDLKLWYCERCTKLIHPPGDVGHVVSSEGSEREDQHYCKECESFAAPNPKMVAGAVLVGKGDSKIKIPAAVRGNTTAAIAAASTTKPKAEDKEEFKKEEPPKKQTTMAIMVGAGAAILLILMVVLLLSGPNKKDDVAVKPTEPPKPTQTKPVKETPNPTPTSDIPTSKPFLEPPKPTLQEPEKPTPPSVPVSNGKPVKTNELVVDTLKKALADVDSLEKQFLYARALKLLDDTRAKSETASWWKENEKDWTASREKVEQSRKKLEKEAADSHTAIAKATKLEELDAIAATWKPRATDSAGDGAEQAQRILSVLALERIKMTHEQETKTANTLIETVDKLEKEWKAKPFGKALESFQKSVESVEEQLKTSIDAVDKAGERLAALRIDAQAGKNPEMSIFKGTVTTRGPATEILYDFSNTEQLNGWTIDRIANHQTAEISWDNTRKALIYKYSGPGEQNVDRGRGANTFIRTPFYFRPEAWVFEGEMWLVSDSTDASKEKTTFGLALWDGEGHFARVRLRSMGNGNEMEYFIQANTPSNNNIQTRPTGIAGRATEVNRVQMAYNQGTLNVAVGNSGKISQAQLKIPASFVPKYFALIGINRENSNAVVGFKNIKMTGVLDKEALSKSYQSERSAAINELRGEYLKAATTLRYAAMKNWGAPNNLALFRPATQTDTKDGREATQAVDGSLESNNFSLTNDSMYPWWQVDLGIESDISEITIFNRNAFPEHLKGFHIMVSKKPFESPDLEQCLKNSVWSTYQKDVCGRPSTFPVGCTGRYVRIQHDHKGHLQMSEIQVLGFRNSFENLAFNKPATQSSVEKSETADHAVDGNTDGDLGRGSVAMTTEGPESWWQVDLMASCHIESVMIFNRNAYTERVQKYHVFISEKPFTSNSVAETLKQPGVWDSFQEGVAGRPTRITAGTNGRYVRIQLTQKEKLNLAEVMVFGKTNNLSPDLKENLALRKPAQFSSSYAKDKGPEKAVDGDFTMDSMTHTDDGDQNWWQVNLERNAQIDEIVIHNRNDSPEWMKRLRNFQVLVSNQPFPADVKAPELAKLPGVWYYEHPAEAGELVRIPVNQQGRHVRIQMLGRGILNIREVLVLGE